MPEALLLGREEIAGLLDPALLPEVLAEGFRAISAGTAVAPARGDLAVGGAGHLLTMPAFVPGQQFSTKLVSIFHDNAERGLPSHLGLIVLMDPETGAVSALMDARHITAMRTAGAAALAATLLSRPDSRVLTILGGGVQGEAHLDLLSRQFALETIFVGSRNRASAEALATRDPRCVVIDDVEAAVRGSDIVCLCTSATEPLIRNAWLKPGQHVSSVGWAPPGCELDPAIAAEHALFVEARMAFAPPPAGCVELAGLDPDRGTELGEVLLGRKPGRQTPGQITVYKAMGHAIEDLVVANLVYRTARERAAGRTIAI
ncbi:ornithine cyclodeaminase family protein [Sphingomonas sp. HITSZ_GF]|uniref:ornithine cyclodeaminase family protein n=1 Tax=Sphingomonas sp. HITSZ_GF TaxID=3037247 RepID=UPI00240E723A|nr:ornithine cyclodeaminase family protein [Sphingomonas sp. HITSZ_GF]MDG2534181.1 ornithine cyclodeaminase family protein [Sphingomonas sp. HITSZ_GF]